MEENQLPSKKPVFEHCCLLDVNYSSPLLSSKIADIPHKLKYETILAPIFEYCFGTSDQDKVWETRLDEIVQFIQDYDLKHHDDFQLKLLNFRTDWIRDETFIFSQLYNLSDINFVTCARRFGFFNNRKFILNAISYFHGHVIFYNCNPLFTNDFEIMMAAVKEHGGSIESLPNIAFASGELKNNREIVKQAVKRDGDVIQYISNEWLFYHADDKEIVMLALESEPRTAYENASLRLKKDREVVFKAVSHGYPISYVDNSFNNDRELVLISSKIDGKGTLYFACSELKKDKEIVLQAIQQDPDAFYCASNELQNDREFVKEIVKKYGKCLEFASREIQDDKEIVELALKSYPDAIYSISDRLRRDIKFISNIIGKRGFKRLPKEFSHDRQIVLESIKENPKNMKVASVKLQNDREFVLQVVKNCGMALEFIKFKSDPEIIMEAITQNGDALQFVPSTYLVSEIIIKAAQTATNSMLSKKLPDHLKNDTEFLMKCSSLFFNLFPRKYQLDREIVMETVKTRPDSVLKYSYPLVVSDRVLAIRIVKRNGLVLGKLPFKYRNDRELVTFAIQQNKKAFKFISDELKNDLEFLKLLGQ